MSGEVVQTSFEYGQLGEQARIRLQVKAESIRSRMKRTAEDIIAIGQDLTEVKSDLGHGLFLDWIASEFEMSQQSARNFMQVSERFGDKSTKFVDLSPSVLYALAAPSTSDKIIEQVESGDIAPNLAAIKEAKEAERVAKEHATTLQCRLIELQIDQEDATRERARTIALLEDQLTDLNEKLATMQTPEIREVEKIVEVESPELQEKLKATQQEVKHIEAFRMELYHQLNDLRSQSQVMLQYTQEEQPYATIAPLGNYHVVGVNDMIPIVQCPACVCIEGMCSRKWIPLYRSQRCRRPSLMRLRRTSTRASNTIDQSGNRFQSCHVISPVRWTSSTENCSISRKRWLYE